MSHQQQIVTLDETRTCDDDDDDDVDEHDNVNDDHGHGGHQDADAAANDNEVDGGDDDNNDDGNDEDSADGEVMMLLMSRNVQPDMSRRSRHLKIKGLACLCVLRRRAGVLGELAEAFIGSVEW